MVNPTIDQSSMTQRYSRLPDRFDEMKDAGGQIRPHWNLCVDEFDGLGADGLNRRTEAVEKMVRENGTTSEVGSDQDQESRPWQVANLPVVVDAASWKLVESGLKQRTLLLSRILEDFLGEQHLLRDGIVPPELLWSNPYFLRVYHSLPTSIQRLQITATEVSRDVNGNWLVQKRPDAGSQRFGILAGKSHHHQPTFSAPDPQHTNQTHRRIF